MIKLYLMAVEIHFSVIHAISPSCQQPYLKYNRMSERHLDSIC